ncbi:MAG: gamma-glutamyl-gamma-aminobutyrate hydrolase family protein [Alphaproteobacteria bacterium]|nr:gamma-glutamyl-gamma-aminobutyrate hydrolase family protein [Alphaproteobacteria bacterium]
MTLVAITQRVLRDPSTDERRDALDQRWTRFLAAAGLLALVLPNHLPSALALVRRFEPAGVILTGGGDLVAYGGDAAERDATEAALVSWAMQAGRPVLGACRGMQQLLHLAGARLDRVEAHVRTRHKLVFAGRPIEVNSYHDFAIRSVPDQDYAVLAEAPDGTVEAVRHRRLPQLGIMWHPEREAPFAAHDIALFRGHFGVAVPAEAASAEAACAD